MNEWLKLQEKFLILITQFNAYLFELLSWQLRVLKQSQPSMPNKDDLLYSKLSMGPAVSRS